jgi:hypothetical protein
MEEEKYDEHARHARHNALFHDATNAALNNHYFRTLRYVNHDGNGRFVYEDMGVDVTNPRAIQEAIDTITQRAQFYINSLEGATPNQANYLRSIRTLANVRNDLADTLLEIQPRAAIPHFPEINPDDLDLTDREYGQEIQNALRGEGIKKGKNPWIAHIKKVQKEKGISYKEAMKIAKHSYK